MENLTKIAEVLRDGFEKSKVNLSKEEKQKLCEQIENLSNSELDVFFHELIADADDFADVFYERVSNLQFYIGLWSSSEVAVSRLWILAYNKIEGQKKKEDFLNYILKEDRRYIWNLMKSLPLLCSEIRLTPTFAANWFFNLAERVKGDLAGGGVYDAIENYTVTFPSEALKVFKIYEEQLSVETKLNIASLMLGILRCDKNTAVQAIDNRLKSRTNVNKRACYYDSIFKSYRKGCIELYHIPLFLDQMLEDKSKRVRDVAYLTVYRGVIDGKKEFIELALSWFNKNCSNSISAHSKYYVMSSMWRLCSDITPRSDIDCAIANEILSKILPISNEHLGTLDKLSDYLCDRIKNVKEFTNTTLCLVTDGIENLFFLFEHDRFEHFRSELSKVDLTHLITELIFSGDSKKCKLGFLFLQYSKFTPYTAKTLIKVKDDHVSVALKQLMKERNLNQTIAKKVQFLEPFFRTASQELQNDFVNEIIIQAVNYSQGCLKEIKRFGRSRLIKIAIVRAEKYFENFKKAQNSPANGFSFPGYREACFRDNKRLNARIEKLAEGKSVFMSLVKKVQLIYGHEFSFSVGQSISDASQMVHFENSMELPRLEVIDPEGMIIRRLSGK